MNEDHTLRPDQMNMEAELVREEAHVEPAANQQMQARYAAGRACPRCGAMNDAEALFCSSCGQPLHQSAIFASLSCFSYSFMPPGADFSATIPFLSVVGNTKRKFWSEI